MRRTGLALALLVVPVAVAGCDGKPDAPADDVVTVGATDTACTVSATQLPAGPHTFRVTNSGTKVTEFYVYGPAARVAGEVENIAPGLTRDLRVELSAGTYDAVCKPGMAGDGIHHPLTLTGAASAPAAPSDPVLNAAVAEYARYVSTQSDDLLARTKQWVAALKTGDTRAAKARFARTRAPFERIEPIAESFADLDRRIDARDTDLATGEQWTGFHRLENDLWTGSRPDPATADALLADVTALDRQLHTQRFTALDLANGAKSLLDEVASKKVTGEEDHFSHTDLWDFAANIDGCRAVIKALRAAVDRRDPALGPLIDERFATVDALLARYRDGAGRYADYTKLSPAQVRELSDAINGLAEPVSHLATAVSSR
ncbi:iron uptake system protein EfeO [Nucisporomicrobium flavum]|uniref:iron uptake system protein EfeO n=1 Tax=Nucisporomicrobium flavum TaxID=2785915 RepID=UPI003C3070E1